MFYYFNFKNPFLVIFFNHSNATITVLFLKIFHNNLLSVIVHFCVCHHIKSWHDRWVILYFDAPFDVYSNKGLTQRPLFYFEIYGGSGGGGNATCRSLPLLICIYWTAAVTPLNSCFVCSVSACLSVLRLTMMTCVEPDTTLLLFFFSNVRR